MHIPHRHVGAFHFIGIGGIGMSGIAEVLNALGYIVQGSDVAENANVKRLRAKGVHVYIGHDADHIQTPQGDLAKNIVISSAIKQDNPELIAARQLKIPLVKRAEMLAELMRLKWGVAVGGTHGKTTTTSMVGTILEGCGFDPTVINGGIVNAYGTNTRLGQGDWMVAEADESDGTFTRLPATIAIVTNMDPEHLDHYGSYENMKLAFRQFIENVPFYGCAIVCTDHTDVQALRATIHDKRIISYGFNPQADIQAVNVRTQGHQSMFDVIFDSNNAERTILNDVVLPVLGAHNISNSLAALAVGYELGASLSQMRDSLAGFEGVKRRFTKTGEFNGITIIDDYGHHPVEIAAVLKAARQAVADTGGRIIAVKQPHRYSRLNDLFEGFCTCFNDADHVIIADVYAAGEQEIEGVNKESLAQGLRDHGHKSVYTINSDSELAPLVLSLAQPNDYVICLGAGNITQWANQLPQSLRDL